MKKKMLKKAIVTVSTGLLLLAGISLSHNQAYAETVTSGEQAVVLDKTAALPLENISARFGTSSPNMWTVNVKSTPNYSITDKAIRFYTANDSDTSFYQFPSGTTNPNGVGVTPEIYRATGTVYITVQEAGKAESEPVAYIYDPDYVIGTEKTAPVPLESLEVQNLSSSFQVRVVYNFPTKYDSSNKLFRYYLSEDQKEVFAGYKRNDTFIGSSGYQLPKNKLTGNSVYMTVQENGKLESEPIQVILVPEEKKTIATIFPDPTLSNEVAKQLNKSVDDTMSAEEAQKITIISLGSLISDPVVYDTTGLDSLPNLTQLYLNGGNSNKSFLSIDLSQNKKLESLSLNNYGLKEIDLSQNLELKSLSFYKTDLTSLNVQSNLKLVSVNFYSAGNIKTLDVKDHPPLKELVLRYSGIIDLNTENCPLLETVILA